MSYIINDFACLHGANFWNIVVSLQNVANRRRLQKRFFLSMNSPFVRFVDNVANFNIRRPIFRWKVPIGGFLWNYDTWRFTHRSHTELTEGMIQVFSSTSVSINIQFVSKKFPLLTHKEWKLSKVHRNSKF